MNNNVTDSPSALRVIVECPLKLVGVITQLFAPVPIVINVLICPSEPSASVNAVAPPLWSTSDIAEVTLAAVLDEVNASLAGLVL